MDPAPVLARVRGAVCVFPLDAEAPLWILERCVWPVDDRERDGADDDVASTEPGEETIWSLVRNSRVDASGNTQSILAIYIHH